ncbi:MAG: 8-oxo-dGTP diphosphatase [Lachnospiraceae bacterium]|nr:8-oxo-dGTP diphosphatase [Lachnospiraceae bacterium]
MKQELTTLCYAESAGHLLMLHRVKKEHDINKDKWIGVGGHLEWGESPEEGIRRELAEETGMQAGTLTMRGVLTFVYGEITEIIFLFMAHDLTDADGRAVTVDTPLPACDEGELAWVEWDRVNDLPIWEGDRAFLKLLRAGAPFFSMKLIYDDDGNLLETRVESGSPDL